MMIHETGKALMIEADQKDLEGAVGVAEGESPGSMGMMNPTTSVEGE